MLITLRTNSKVVSLTSHCTATRRRCSSTVMWPTTSCMPAVSAASERWHCLRRMLRNAPQVWLYSCREGTKDVQWACRHLNGCVYPYLRVCASLPDTIHVYAYVQMYLRQWEGYTQQLLDPESPINCSKNDLKKSWRVISFVTGSIGDFVLLLTVAIMLLCFVLVCTVGKWLV